MKKIINLEKAQLEYFPDFLEKIEADLLLKSLINLNVWRQDKIKMFGKEVLQPRLTALFGEKGKTYKYSGLQLSPLPFTEDLKRLKVKCEEKSNESKFNVCLANMYRDGNDSMGWHADDEKELGENPVIASVSLGEERIFHFKHKANKDYKYKIRLQHGSLLIMKGETQKFWKHQLPKSKRVLGPRINLTFRYIV